MTASKETGLIHDLEELRAFLHTSVLAKNQAWEDHNENGTWSKLWTSFDNIHDCQRAIDRFKVGDTGKLGIFGLLQAMAVQQDAIKHIEEAVGLSPTKLLDLPLLKEIRDVRDETTGHPTKTLRDGRQNSKYTAGTITYTSMWTGNGENLKENILEYYVWSASGAERKKLDLNKAMRDQETELSKVLQSVTKKLKENENAHKRKFKDNKLQDVFHQTDYLFSKLYSSETSREYARSCLSQLHNQLAEFKEGVIARYGKQALNDHQAMPGTYEICQQLDQVIKRVDDRIMLPATTDAIDLDVYVESAHNSFKELIDHAKEIDDKFNQFK